jgi:ubiquinol-cytochrome c reductase iron-sulfur subunit
MKAQSFADMQYDGRKPVMSDGDINKSRRRFLVGATSVVGGVGVIGAAVPFVASWNPSAKAKAAGAPVKANFSKIEPGQQITVAWRGKPVWILRRTPEILANIKKLNDVVLDPYSKESSQQPPYCKGIYRSIKEEFLVVVGICTHLGCSPTYRPQIAPPDIGPNWLGGYLCPCHGSKYDLSGRVYKGQPAPLNLLVPPYKYLSAEHIIIGVNEEKA